VADESHLVAVGGEPILNAVVAQWPSGSEISIPTTAQQYGRLSTLVAGRANGFQVRPRELARMDDCEIVFPRGELARSVERFVKRTGTVAILAADRLFVDCQSVNGTSFFHPSRMAGEAVHLDCSFKPPVLVGIVSRRQIPLLLRCVPGNG
jgi:hypothetical protein